MSTARSCISWPGASRRHSAQADSKEAASIASRACTVMASSWLRMKASATMKYSGSSPAIRRGAQRASASRRGRLQRKCACARPRSRTSQRRNTRVNVGSATPAIAWPRESLYLPGVPNSCSSRPASSSATAQGSDASSVQPSDCRVGLRRTSRTTLASASMRPRARCCSASSASTTSTLAT